MRVLCAGDLHIGRRPTRLPMDVDSSRLSCARAWESIVEYAVDQRVELLALSGDVVDQSNRYYEAIGPLERGLVRLREAGVTTVAVAGNHDHDVLPQVARSLNDDSFRLIGVGGVWERVTITSASGERVHVDGWSFPSEHVQYDPLRSYEPQPDGDAPVLGLLHADLDAPGSSYAPVALTDLQARSVALWLLGHVHIPRLVDSGYGAPVLYPGSPQAMDPGEPGVHGAWLAELRPLARPAPTLIPLSGVRYDADTVDVDGAAAIDDLRGRLERHVTSTMSRMARESADHLRVLSLRVAITGATALHREVRREAAIVQRDFDWRDGDVRGFVETVSVDTRPARDLEALARGDDAVAVLAQLALELASDDPLAHSAPIMGDVREVANALIGARQYRHVEDVRDGFDDAALRTIARQQSLALLDELLSQKDPA